MFSPFDPLCPPEEAVAAVAIVTVDFFLLLEDFVVVDAWPPTLPAGNTVAREGAGATEFEGREDAAAGAGAATGRGGMEAVGSATGGRVDMVLLRGSMNEGEKVAYQISLRTLTLIASNSAQKKSVRHERVSQFVLIVSRKTIQIYLMTINDKTSTVTCEDERLSVWLCLARVAREPEHEKPKSDILPAKKDHYSQA